MSKPSQPGLMTLSILTWFTVLLVSDLPNAIWQAINGEPPAWLFWLKIGLLLVLILISLTWKLIQPVRIYFFLLLILMLSLWAMNSFRGTAAYSQWEARSGWFMGMIAFQSLKLAVAFIMIVSLLLMGRQWKDFFLTPGDLKAPIRAGNNEATAGKRSISWGTLGILLGLTIAPLTLLFFGLGNLPSGDILTKLLPLLPGVLVFAGTNAFSEEVQYRAALLGDVKQPLGDDQALWMTAVFFGFMHYFGGSPSGIPGFLIAVLLGALFARCMLGSRGIVVPWFIHFCQNVVIYAFWAIGAVA
jgi:membrane protease YdiL (CAAX protease family)